MAKKTKVFWNDQEKTQMAAKMDHLIHVTGGYTPISALTAAERELPENRRRGLRFWAQARDQLQPFLEKAKLARELASRTSAATAEAPAKPAMPTVEQLLTQAFTQVFLNVLNQAPIQAALKSILAGEQPKEVVLPAPTPGHEKRRPKVLIAGLLPVQSEEIKKTFDSRLELKFWGSHESKEHLRNMVKRVDVAVGVTNFIGHPADDILKSLAPSYVRHPGGISSLKGTLSKVLMDYGTHGQAPGTFPH